MTLTRLIARPLIASTFVLGGMNALKNAPQLAPKARKVTDKVVPLAQKAVPAAPIPTDPQTLIRLNAATQIAAAAAFATGRAPRLSAMVLAGTLVPTTVAGHAFWAESDPMAKQQQKLHFTKNASLLGGLLLAAVDTEGKPGVAWRTRRAAADARRNARQIAKDARREAKLAKAQLT